MLVKSLLFERKGSKVFKGNASCKELETRDLSHPNGNVQITPFPRLGKGIFRKSASFIEMLFRSR